MVSSICDFLPAYFIITSYATGLYFPQRLREPKTFEVSLVVNEQDFVYVTNDYYRPLQYLCEEFDACQITLETDSTMVTMVLLFTRPVPILSGPLKLCKIERRSFIAGFESAQCQELNPQLDMTSSALESGQEILEVDTYYMTAKNYEEMRRGKTTDVFLPENEGQSYYLTAFIYHYRAFAGCTLTTPMEIVLGRRLFSSNNILNKIVFDGLTKGKTSGLYTVQCYGWDWAKNLSKTLNFHFVSFPAIVFEGIQDDIVYLSRKAEEIIIRALFVSIRGISSYDFRTSSGRDSDADVRLAPHSEWEAVSIIEISFYYSHITLGRFTLSVTDNNRVTVSKGITISKKTDMEIFINPMEMDVLEGFYAVFECFVKGDLVAKLEWSRDFEHLHKDKYIYSTAASEEANHTVLRLVLADLKLAHSGFYICRASDSVQVVSTHAILNVWPYEHPYIARILANKSSPKRVISSYVPAVPYRKTGKNTAILPNEAEFFGWFLVLNIMLLLVLVAVILRLFVYRPLMNFYHRKTQKVTRKDASSSEEDSDITSEDSSS